MVQHSTEYIFRLTKGSTRRSLTLSKEHRSRRPPSTSWKWGKLFFCQNKKNGEYFNLEVALGSQKLDSQAKLLSHVDRAFGLDNLQRLQRWANTGGALDLLKEQVFSPLPLHFRWEICHPYFCSSPKLPRTTSHRRQLAVSIQSKFGLIFDPLSALQVSHFPRPLTISSSRAQREAEEGEEAADLANKQRKIKPVKINLQIWPNIYSNFVAITLNYIVIFHLLLFLAPFIIHSFTIPATVHIY